MSGLLLSLPLFRWGGTHRFGLLDSFLILLGAGIAYWLIPGLSEGIGQ